MLLSRVDYCNAILAGAYKSTTDKLQRFMNAAARVDSGTRKYDRRLTDLLHDELQCLDARERVQYNAVCNGSPMSAAQGSTVVHSFRRDLKIFSSRSTSVHSVLEALRLCAI